MYYLFSPISHTFRRHLKVVILFKGPETGIPVQQVWTSWPIAPCGQQWLSIHREGKFIKWKQCRNGQLTFDLLYPHPTYHTGPHSGNARDSRSFSFTWVVLGPGLVPWTCGQSLPTELSPSMVVRNYAVIFLFHSPARIQRILRLQDDWWLKLPTNKFGLRCINHNAEAQDTWKNNTHDTPQRTTIPQ
jgi:hypothetical protein